MITGIYLITNIINNKKYIGQSVDINKRFREHIYSSLNANAKDANSPLHQAIRKYGKENFCLTILEECNREDLNEKECFWIQYHDSYHKGYNATLGGDSDSRYNGKEVELYNFDGKFIKSYPTVTFAAEDLGVSRHTLYQILAGKRLSTKGYQLKYANDASKQITKYKNNQGGKIPVCQLDNTGKILKVYESAAEAARFISGDASCITKVCKHKLKTHKGYGWCYYNEI